MKRILCLLSTLLMLIAFVPNTVALMPPPVDYGPIVTDENGRRIVLECLTPMDYEPVWPRSFSGTVPYTVERIYLQSFIEAAGYFMDPDFYELSVGENVITTYEKHGTYNRLLAKLPIIC